jgi:prepilin-type N-terminal cleavage/methylation domain-containing protein
MKRSGFTFIEMLVVLVMIGVMLAMTSPAFRVKPTQKVSSSAQQLLRDLELARTRAMSTRKRVRIVFDPVAGTYTGYLDHDRDSIINETPIERQALQVLGLRELPPDVRFGPGSAGPVPGDASAAATTFAGDRFEIAANGVTEPFGTRGSIYLVHRDDPTAVAAVTVTGSASFKLWEYRGGWQP